MLDFDEVFARPIATVVSSNAHRGGASDVAIVEGAEWPELGGAQGYLKRQTHYFCHPPWNAFRPTLTVVREARLLARAHARGVPAPDVLLHAHDDGRGYLLTRAIVGGKSLREALAMADEARRAALIDAAARAFVALHRARILHGALYDTHVLVDRDDHVVLVDFEKARTVLSPSLAAIRDLRRFFRRARGLSARDRDRLLDAYRRDGFRVVALWRGLTR